MFVDHHKRHHQLIDLIQKELFNALRFSFVVKISLGKTFKYTFELQRKKSAFSASPDLAYLIFASFFFPKSRNALNSQVGKIFNSKIVT